MFEMGAAVALGLIVIMLKCGWTIRMWVLSNPVKMDLGVFTLLTVLHWGTFSGVMAATIGALMVSLVLSMGRKIYGFRVKGKYVPGWTHIGHKL